MLVARRDTVKLQPKTKTEISLKIRPREEQTISIGYVKIYLFDLVLSDETKIANTSW